MENTKEVEVIFQRIREWLREHQDGIPTEEVDWLSRFHVLDDMKKNVIRRVEGQYG